MSELSGFLHVLAVFFPSLVSKFWSEDHAQILKCSRGEACTNRVGPKFYCNYCHNFVCACDFLEGSSSGESACIYCVDEKLHDQGFCFDSARLGHKIKK